MAALALGLLALATYAGLELDYGRHSMILMATFEVIYYSSSIGCLGLLAANVWKIFKPLLKPLLTPIARAIANFISNI